MGLIHSYKIKWFEQDYPDKSYPEFLTLDYEKYLALREQMNEKLYLDELDHDVLINSLERYLVHLEADLESKNFSLIDLMLKNQVELPQKIYLYWFDETIDQMSLIDVDQNFLDVWYKGADDILIFDADFCFFVRIYNNGKIALAKFT
ncbi:MAG: hypothetical protein KC646_00370 [Candidatus Cloacimonetes bacterium]|nr:hypothetical protein [Candidatus Cloacimonadota bacterium]